MTTDDLFGVRGKVALVTGGSRGIGAMIASAFVENGVRTYISSRKADACDATAAALSENGDCVAIPCDLASMDGVRYLSEALGEREEKLDILVNNAGATWGEPARQRQCHRSRAVRKQDDGAHIADNG